VPRCDLILELALDPDGSLDLFREWSAPVSSTIVRNDGDADCESTVLAPEEVFLALHSPDPTVDVGLSYEPPAGDNETRLFSYTVTGNTGRALQIAHGHNYAHYDDDNILQVDEIWPPGFLAWNSSMTVDVSSGVSDWYDDCGSDVDSSTVAPLAETAMATQTLHPAESRIDVWALVMPKQDQVQLRIATDVDASLPFLWINWKGCTNWQASGNVHCNAGDAGTSCPAIWTTLVAGTYEVAMRATGSADVPYELWYELPAGATLEILEDDIVAPPDQRYEITTFGTVEVTWEKR
jgi:hypothetical protein